MRISNGSTAIVAGTGVAGFAGDGGPAANAMLDSPVAVAVDSDGTLFIADAGNNRVRRVLNGMIMTVAGNGGAAPDGDGGPATDAAIGTPLAVAVNSADALFIAANGRIRRVAEGVITTLAGDDTPLNPRALAIDAAGSLYVAEQSPNAVWRLANRTLSKVSTEDLAGPAFVAGSLAIVGSEHSTVDSGLRGEIRTDSIPAIAQPGPSISSVTTVYGSSTLSQNAWVAIRGVRLVPVNTPSSGQDWSSAPDFASGRMPTNLNGVGVYVNGFPAYIYFYCSAVTDPGCSQDQINILTPLDNSQGSIQVVVNNDGVFSSPYTSVLNSSAPSFFQWSGRYAVATRGDGTGVGATTLFPGYTTPAHPNDTIVLWMTGFGLTSTPLTQGSSSQRGNLPFLPSIQINGISATVTFAGVVSPGLYQINVVIPANVPAGDVPVSVTYNGVSAPAGNYITIAASSTPSPAISSFSATPSSINSGQSATLNWSVSNATTVSLDNNIGTVTVTSRVVSPTTTTTYRLTASNSTASVSATATVTVAAAAVPLPTISGFSASPSSINSGQTATLSWNVSNATSLSIDNNIGTVTGTSRVVSPTTTTTYRLTASNSTGSVSATALVTVVVASAPSIAIFTTSATSITSGQSATLSWNVSNATSISIDNGIGAVASSGTKTVSPGSSTTYTLTATSTGGTRTATVTVNVSAPPASCAISGGAANDTYFISNSSTLSKHSWWVQSFTVNGNTNFQLRVASDYNAQTAVFAPSQLNAFENNGSFSAYELLDNQFGTQSFTLGAGSYYVGIRDTSNAASNQYGLELDLAMAIPGLSYIDTYLSQSDTVAANNGKLWQPFTIQCGIRYLMDGANSGLRTYIIADDQLNAFKAGQTFNYYSDYSSDSDDTSQPGYYEVKLPAGNYDLVFLNDTSVTKAVTYLMERWH